MKIVNVFVQILGLVLIVHNVISIFVLLLLGPLLISLLMMALTDALVDAEVIMKEMIAGFVVWKLEARSVTVAACLTSPTAVATVQSILPKRSHVIFVSWWMKIVKTMEQQILKLVTVFVLVTGKVAFVTNVRLILVTRSKAITWTKQLVNVTLFVEIHFSLDLRNAKLLTFLMMQITHVVLIVKLLTQLVTTDFSALKMMFAQMEIVKEHRLTVMMVLNVLKINVMLKQENVSTHSLMCAMKRKVTT